MDAGWRSMPFAAFSSTEFVQHVLCDMLELGLTMLAPFAPASPISSRGETEGFRKHGTQRPARPIDIAGKSSEPQTSPFAKHVRVIVRAAP
jgi:hypothetical protein